MAQLAAYVAALVVFGVIDAVWLSVMGRLLYRPTLGDILSEHIRVVPAAIFYFGYPIGIVLFGALAGLRADAPALAALWGAVFGAFAYATYDLTNYATLRNWTAQITILDIVYGAVTTAICSLAAFYAWRAVAG